VLTALIVPYFVIIWFGVAVYVYRYYKRKIQHSYVFQESDIRWTPKNCAIFGSLGLLAGVSAGTMGISAGMIVGPIFLELNLLPPVITATTAFMIIFAQTSVSIQFILANAISWDIALYFLGVGATASILGQVVLYIKNKISKRDSLLALLMSCVVAASCVSLIFTGISNQVKFGLSAGFSNFCTVTK